MPSMISQRISTCLAPWDLRRPSVLFGACAAQNRYLDRWGRVGADQLGHVANDWQQYAPELHPDDH